MWDDNSPLAFHTFVYKFGEERRNIFIHENFTLFEAGGGVQWFVIEGMDQHMLWTEFGKDRPVIPDIKMMHHAASTWKRSWCAVFLLMNLKAPEWIYTNCKERINSYVCSLENKTKHSISMKRIDFPLLTACPRDMIKIDLYCLKTVWAAQQGTSQVKYLQQGMQRIKHSLLLGSTVQIVLCNTLKITPVLFCGATNCTTTTVHHYDKFQLKYTVKREVKDYAGFHLFQKRLFQVTVGSNIIECDFGSYISVLKLCSKNKCATKSYQTLCTCSETKAKQQCCPSLKRMNRKGLCVPFMTLQESVKQPDASNNLSRRHSKPNVFICTTGIILPAHLVDDLVPDCGTDGEDENILKALIINNTKTHCKDRNQIPCHQGHTQCFDISVVCVFQLSKYFHNVPCRNAAHLHNCTHFQCNTLFKCPGFYCIAWKYVCNDRWNCPHGADETKSVCHFFKECRSMFRCQNICTPLASLCDGVADCFDTEDELLCQLSEVPCPRGCSCFAFALKCKNTFLKFPLTVPFVYISIDHSPQTSQILFNSLPYLITANLFRVSLGQVCNIIPSHDLQVLLLMFDNVPDLGANCFKTNKMLFTLHLSFNQIATIHENAFVDLNNLHTLNLTMNHLTSLSKTLFQTCLGVLSLSWNPLSDVPLDVFSKHLPQLLETNDYKICCITSSETECKSNMTWYLSCRKLLPNNVLKVMSWSVSSLTVGLNIISASVYLVWRKRSASNSLLIVSLNCAEIMQGVYLYIIAGSGVSYGDTFAIKQQKWMSSTVCLPASTSALDFCLSSAASQLLLTLSRLMLVIHPVDSDFKRASFIAKHIGHLHFLGFCLSFAFCASLYFSQGSFPNSLCLITVDPTKFVLLCRIVANCILCFHTTASILVIVMSFVLVKKFRESQEAISKSKSKSVSAASLSRTLCMTIVSTTLCWFPSDAVFLTALFLPMYPINMILWTIVTVGQFTNIVTPITVGVSLLRSVWKESKQQSVK